MSGSNHFLTAAGKGLLVGAAAFLVPAVALIGAPYYTGPDSAILVFFAPTLLPFVLLSPLRDPLILAVAGLAGWSLLGAIAGGIWSMRRTSRPSFPSVQDRHRPWLRKLLPATLLLPTLITAALMGKGVIQAELAEARLRRDLVRASHPSGTGSLSTFSGFVGELGLCFVMAGDIRKGVDWIEAYRHYSQRRPTCQTCGWTVGYFESGSVIFEESQAVSFNDFPSSALESTAWIRVASPVAHADYVLLAWHAIDQVRPGDPRCMSLVALNPGRQKADEQRLAEQARLRMGRPVPGGLSGQEALAYRCLRQAVSWKVDTAGSTGRPSSSHLALEILARSGRGAEPFRMLYEEAQLVGKLYSLAALARFGPAFFSSQLPRFQRLSFPVAIPGGGDIVRIGTVGDIIAELGGNSRTAATHSGDAGKERTCWSEVDPGKWRLALHDGRQCVVEPVAP